MALSIRCVAVVAAIVIAATASVGWDDCAKLFPSSSFFPFEQPKSQRICRDTYIAISYDTTMIDPAFSAYYITPQDLNSTVPGRDEFYEDPDLQSLGIKQAPTETHAFNSTWNKGHLAPSHIFSHTTEMKKACYTMANIAPQAYDFNQQPWGNLEDNVFKWIQTHRALYIITGVAYFDRSNPSRTFDDIAVPDFYFKVLCDVTTRQAVGFLGANKISDDVTVPFTTVEAVEKQYGGPLLPRDRCNVFSYNRTYWW